MTVAQLIAMLSQCDHELRVEIATGITNASGDQVYLEPQSLFDPGDGPIVILCGEIGE